MKHHEFESIDPLAHIFVSCRFTCANNGKEKNVSKNEDILFKPIPYRYAHALNYISYK